MQMSDIKSEKQLEIEASARLMKTIAKRAGYYRKNLHKFCFDYLQIKNLKWFQKILLWIMNEYDNSLLIACRGLGKTYICSLFAVCRCVLWPGQRVLAVSATYKQARNMIKKVTEDFMINSPLLRNEILKWSDGQNDCYIQFKNGSIFRAITATESSLGFRSHILLEDERRLLPEQIVATIIRPMNATPRQPKYLKKYPDKVEMLKEISLSSAWYAMSELCDIAKSYCAGMLEGDKSFAVVDLPYQVSIKESLLMPKQILNEKSQATFNEITFSMEREGLFWGSTADALFDYKVLNERRVLKESLHSLDFYKKGINKIPDKKKDELRILSVDIALLASKKHDNDASAIIIHSAIPTNMSDYTDNVIYIETQEGLLTEELGLLIMRYFYQYDCDYIAIDANGVGQSTLDYLMGGNRFDPEYNQTYPCLDVINNPDISERCKVKGSAKVIYAIKANAKSNNDMCLSLRAAFQNGYINLLVSDNDIEDTLSHIRGYNKLSQLEQERLKMPYIQTSFLINELVNLTHDVSNNMIKVKEKSGMRKDRYSSLEYGWYVVQEQAKKLRPKTETVESLLNKFAIRQAKSIID